VLSEWSFGFWVNFFSERPNIANPFLLGEVHRRAVLDVSRFFLLEDGEEAAAFSRQLGARYVLMIEPLPGKDISYLGLDSRDYFGEDAGGDGPTGVRYFSTVGARLYYTDGSAANVEGANVDALSHFRLVYESLRESDIAVNLGRHISASKVFEFVEGARVKGRAAPGSVVSARATVSTNRGREFQFHTRASADAEGLYELVLPYSVTGNPYDTGAVGPYIAENAGQTREVVVDEAEVAAGALRLVDFL
jgi:dolichyl-diphosphooligosaccharide--protein glycosyltransferase